MRTHEIGRRYLGRPFPYVPRAGPTDVAAMTTGLVFDPATKGPRIDVPAARSRGGGEVRIGLRFAVGRGGP